MSLINDALKRAHQSIKKNPPDMSTSPEIPPNDPENPQNSADIPPANIDAPAEIPELQPAIESPTGGAGGSMGIAVILVCVLVCLGAAWGIWKYINSSPAKVAAVPVKISKTNNLTKVASPTNSLAKAPAAAAKPLSNIVSRTEAKLRAAKAATGADDFDNEGKPIAVEKPAVKPPAPAEKQLAAITKPIEQPAPVAAPDLANVPSKPIEKPAEPAPAEKVAAAPAKAVEKTSFPEVRLQGIFYRLTRPSAMLSGQTVYVGDELKGTNVKVKAIDRQSVTLELEGETTVLTMR